MAIINPNGTVSVGNAAGAGRSVNGLTSGTPNVQTNITTRETTYMGGNPARITAAGAVCMPRQAQITTPIPNVFNGNAIIYNNVQATAWRSTALSEFRAAYTTRPVIASAVVTGNGTAGQGTLTITVTPPADAVGTCSVYLQNLSTAWATVNAANQITYTIVSGVTYTAYVKDINNCGANMEISWTGITYNL
jgi:hypothetical protein